MRKNLFLNIILCALIVLMTSFFTFATQNRPLAPGSTGEDMDFSNLTKGLFYNGDSFYFLLDTGVIATNYMLNLNGTRYYFGDDGKMVHEQIIQYEDEYYYFDTDGSMAKDRWVVYEYIDEINNSVDRTAYYFGPHGRAYRATGDSRVVIKEIDGEKYGFNDEAERLEGYISVDGEELDQDTEYAYSECMYYFDPLENYVATVGWHLYLGTIDENVYDPDKEMYLYFDEKTCRKVHSPYDDKYLKRIIDGERYMFNYDGVRYHEWYGSVASASSPKYFSEDFDGFLAKGWFVAIPSATSKRVKNQERHKSEEEMWFYADNRGRVLKSCIRQIGRYTYCFDEDGVMLSDAFAVVTNGNKYVATYDAEDITKKQVLYGAEDGGILQDGQKWMYFAYSADDDSTEGARSGLYKNVVVEVKDDELTFCANANGGLSSEITTSAFERSGKLYQNGVLLHPIDNNYGIVRRSKQLVTGDMDGFADHYYYAVVDRGGNVKTKYGSFKDNDDNYILCRTNGEFVGIFTCKTEYIAYKGIWRYYVDKEWHTGFPPLKYRVWAQEYYLNFDEYELGIADEYATKYQ